MKTFFLFVLIVMANFVKAQKETVLYNAKVFTANPSKPFADAVGIRGNTIIAVGKFNDVKAAMSAKAELIDLGGGFLMPGMVDAHSHVISGGQSLLKANLSEDYLPIEDLLKFVRRHLSEKKGMTGDILLVYGVNISTWVHIDQLNKNFNGKEFDNQAIYLSGSDGHTAWVNQKMLSLAGISKSRVKELPVSKQQYFGFDKEGELNGFIADSGLNILDEVLPPEPEPDSVAALAAMKHCNSLGLTAWLDPSAANVNTGRENALMAYQYLINNKKLTAHVAATLVADANLDPQPQISKLKSLQAKYSQSPNLNIIGFKIFADGVLEFPAQTAAISLPYTNHSQNGKLLFEPSRFTTFATLADKQGLQMHVHAIGDLAVTETLNGFEAMRKANGNDQLPHTITHLQLVLPKDVPRFQSLNVLAAMQLIWAFGDVTIIDIVKPYIDPALYKHQYPARSMSRAGALICGASDWPVSSANPFKAMATAETRKGPMNIVLDSTQRMPRMSMLYAYTLNAAISILLDKSIGSIEPGKFADIIHVDRDVTRVKPEELAETKVKWTMFEGKIIYRSAN
jgi:predicted amidohydrolase YtcJ